MSIHLCSDCGARMTPVPDTISKWRYSCPECGKRWQLCTDGVMRETHRLSVEPPRPSFGTGFMVLATREEISELRRAADSAGLTTEDFVKREALKAARYRNTH